MNVQGELQKQAAKGLQTGKLDIATNTLATRVVFADTNPKRVIGVECLTGKALYNARHHDVPPGKAGKSFLYLVKKEVILCGGAFKLLRNANFRGQEDPEFKEGEDPVYEEWRKKRKGLYTTNGSVLGIIMRSSTRKKGDPDDPRYPSDPPDLYIFGVPGIFRGYEINYSEKSSSKKRRRLLTWHKQSHLLNLGK